MSELALKLIAENKAKHERGEDARVLDLGNCGLIKIPNQLFDCIWIEELILGKGGHRYNFHEKILHIIYSKNERDPNSLTLLFPKIGLFDWINSPVKKWKKLINLKILILQGYAIEGRSVIDLSHLKGLSRLEQLDISGNDIDNLGVLSNFKNLKILSAINTNIDDLTPIKDLTDLFWLSIEQTKVNDLTPLLRLTNIHYLDFEFNVTSLNGIQNLENLQRIHFWRIPVTDFSPLKGLKRLKVIEFIVAKLSDLSPLKELYELEHITVEKGEFEDLSALSNLDKLEYLAIRDTPIGDISPLANLLNLRSLALVNTRISDLTPLRNLHKLKFISIPWNHLVSDISPLKHQIENGVELLLGGTPVKIPPQEIIQQGNVAILNYFAERSKQQFKNTQIKLILLGNSTAGKTTLSCYLREQTYGPNQPTTHGIQNHRWQIPELDRLEMFQWKPDNKDMVVNIWDFGGQEYYHATHRLFLSRNAVYILVWDAKTDKGGIESTTIHYENDPHSYTIDLEHFPKAWWLKNLNYNLNKYVRHDREGEAPIPVLLVQNKCAAGLEYEEKSMSREFEQKPYFLKPAWTKHHIDLAAAANEQAKGEQGEWTIRFKLFENELLKTLESQMATYEFAIYHRDIRDHVRALASGESPVNEMPWTDFETLCRNIEPDSKMDLIQIYLRDITGDILYFDQNERLKQRVFLRPDWVCNRIYDILSRKVLEREGLFDLDWVCEALQCDERDALDFVELMREFQLVFEENDENGNATGNFVAPQYLPDVCINLGELEGAKKYATLVHAFTLWFPEFLPKSHMARFVAHWGHQAQQRLFWKNGLLFQTDGCTVLVERQEEFKIRVAVQMSHVANREKAIPRVFQSFLDLEDGQAGFAISLDEKHFAFWQNVQKATRIQAKQVEVYSPDNPPQLIELKPFFILHKPITMAKKVFISYSHKDESFKDDLDTHFSALKRSGLVEVWHDRRIDAGTEWDDAIKSELESADIILLLVSANFLASDYIWKVEIARAMERHRAKEAKVIPIFTRSCDTKGMPFEGIQGLPRDAKPIATFTDKDEAYVQIAKGIRAILET